MKIPVLDPETREVIEGIEVCPPDPTQITFPGPLPVLLGEAPFGSIAPDEFIPLDPIAQVELIDGRKILTTREAGNQVADYVRNKMNIP